MNLIHQRCLYMVITPFCLLVLMHLPYFVKASRSATNDFLSDNAAIPFISLVTQHHYYQTLYNPLHDMNQFVWILLDTIARLWIGVECLFYLYFVVTHNRLQPLRKSTQPLTKQRRTETYYQCFDAIDDMETWCVGWFYIQHDMSHPLFEQIHRGNIAMW
ncbi:hypothetical protein BCR42DRAFT_424690 [Absidia repens]|uniref:Uncharacterized protein n=1 Tax=Absidia repens TaxID=90262 RepID=A0A1X2I590_9FUNG|nr:hypothetical protein BCR42DRAFT_424690 [Absidia repens]